MVSTDFWGCFLRIKERVGVLKCPEFWVFNSHDPASRGGNLECSIPYCIKLLAALLEHGYGIKNLQQRMINCLVL